MPAKSGGDDAKTARLRKFPYPYQAAVTILNDRHGLQTADEFRAFHRFLNTGVETPHGRGLDLEIGDSFWFYDDLQRFSYFQGYDFKLSDQAALIRDFVKAGYIDCLHTYGDFSNHPFERRFAEQAVEEMVRSGLKLNVWVNHGDRNNIQNLNAGVAHHQGANRTSPAYHMDLVREGGFKFFWRRLSPYVGQDRPLSMGEFCRAGTDGHWPGSGSALKRAAKKALMSLGGRIEDKSSDNRLLQPLEFDDGSRVWEFLRFNNHPENLWSGVAADDLVRQLDSPVLDRLTAGQGYSIVYNHLEEGEFYRPEVIAVLRGLAARHKERKIWVATAARILRYNLVRQCLIWTEEREDSGRLLIRMPDRVEDPVFGTFELTADDLQGVSFQLPGETKARLFLGSMELSFKDYGREDGHRVVGLPVRKLAYPD